jgi:hypothetical protein
VGDVGAGDGVAVGDVGADGGAVSAGERLVDQFRWSHDRPCGFAVGDGLFHDAQIGVDVLEHCADDGAQDAAFDEAVAVGCGPDRGGADHDEAMDPGGAHRGQDVAGGGGGHGSVVAAAGADPGQDRVAAVQECGQGGGPGQVRHGDGLQGGVFQAQAGGVADDGGHGEAPVEGLSHDVAADAAGRAVADRHEEEILTVLGPAERSRLLAALQKLAEHSGNPPGAHPGLHLGAKQPPGRTHPDGRSSAP